MTRTVRIELRQHLIDRDWDISLAIDASVHTLGLHFASEYQAMDALVAALAKLLAPTGNPQPADAGPGPKVRQDIDRIVRQLDDAVKAYNDLKSRYQHLSARNDKTARALRALCETAQAIAADAEYAPFADPV